MYCTARMRMAKDTRSIQTKTGTRMQSGFGFIDIDGDDDLPAGVVAFGSLADELAKYKKGATIRISGEFKANNYEKDGKEVKGYQIMAEGIAGVKSATVKHQKDERQSPPTKREVEAQDSFFDDDLGVINNTKQPA